MKSPVILIILLMGAHVAYPQSVSLRAGLSAPSGAFANAASINDDGFANNGTFITACFTYPILRKVHLCLETGHAVQEIQNSGLASAFSHPNASTEVNVIRGYQSTYFAGGGTLIFRQERYFFQLRALAGLLSMQTPEYVVTYTYSSNQGQVKQSSQQVSAPAFILGLEAGLRIYKTWYLSTSLDLVNASLEVEKGYTSSDQQYLEVPYNVYQWGLGVSYVFPD